MPLIDTASLAVSERLPGWRGRIFHSAAMTFAHYEFDVGSTIHEHRHAQEEVWNVVEGELEVCIAGQVQRAGPGQVAIVPPNTLHSVLALTDGRAIVVDHPLRWDMAQNEGAQNDEAQNDRPRADAAQSETS